MLQEIFNQIYKDLKGATSHPKHAFRYATFATALNGEPYQRTVVLRKVLKNNNLQIYTDSRSQKIKHLHQNPVGSMLFYDHKKLTQVIVKGKVVIKTNGKELLQQWSEMQEASKKDYITEKGPGHKIKNPDHVSYLENDNYFTILELIPDKMEYLQLKRPNHIRATFDKTIEDHWEMSFLVP